MSDRRREVALAARVVVTSLLRGGLHVRAAALAYYSILAVIPSFALAFAVSAEAGFVDWLRDSLVVPFLDETLGPAELAPTEGVRSLRATMDGVVALVDQTSLRTLGLAGLVVLLIALRRQAWALDEAFSQVFPRRDRARTWQRRARTFVVAGLMTPLALAYALGAAIAAHGPISEWLDQLGASDAVRVGALSVLALLVASTAIGVLFAYVPRTRLRLQPTLVAASLTGFGWLGVQIVHVQLQVGLARLDALYSGFGAFPLLLGCFHMSWLTLLAGASLARHLGERPEA